MRKSIYVNQMDTYTYTVQDQYLQAEVISQGIYAQMENYTESNFNLFYPDEQDNSDYYFYWLE